MSAHKNFTTKVLSTLTTSRQVLLFFVLPTCTNTLQNHAHKQDLRCAKCFRHFTTLGGLTAHIEFDEGCYGNINLTAKVHETTARDRKMDAARSFKGGWAGGKDVPEDEPRPVLKDWSKIAPPERSRRHASGNMAQSPGSRPLSSNSNNGPAIPHNAAPVQAPNASAWAAPLQTSQPAMSPNTSQAVETVVSAASIGGARFTSVPDISSRGSQAIVAPEDEEDLMSFDAPSRIMNAPWDDVVPQSFDDMYPAMTTYKNPMPTPNIIDAPAAIPTVWVNQRAPAPSPVVSASDQLASDLNTWHIDQPDEPAMSPWDPENPTFNADMYLNDFTKKYRCPHPGCK